MQVGETVTALTIEAVQTFIGRAMSAGAPRDTVIKVSTKQHGHGFVLSADFEPQHGLAQLGRNPSAWTEGPAGLSGETGLEKMFREVGGDDASAVPA